MDLLRSVVLVLLAFSAQGVLSRHDSEWFNSVQTHHSHFHPSSSSISLALSSDATVLVEGESAYLTVNVTGVQGASVLLWPFVNNLQWGSYSTCNSCNSTFILLPLPARGSHSVVVAVLPAPLPGPFPVGQPLPSSVVALSNAVSIAVAPFQQEKEEKGGSANNQSLVGMEWEPWFTIHNDVWNTNEAIPLLGLYHSFHPWVVRQHALWLMRTKIDFLVVDWTNNLWNVDHFADIGVYAQELINATTFTMDVLQNMTKEGYSPPRIVLLLGLDNGPTEPFSCLLEEVRFIEQTYVTRYSSDMWVDLENKPLLVIFDGGGIYAGQAVSDIFTIRWMASQLQGNTLAQRGYWSWMDGAIKPVPTYHQGAVEALTATVAFFGDNGWLGSQTYARRAGATWVQEMQVAQQYQPQFLVICQWNEFAGQPNGSPGYTDSYNVSLSNDFEPTSLTECGLQRSDDPPLCSERAGWGFFYYNLMRATILMYKSPDLLAKYTVLTLAKPLNGDNVVLSSSSSSSSSSLQVEWQIFGVTPTQHFSIAIDGKIVASAGPMATQYALDLSSLALTRGSHQLAVYAVGAVTLFPLSLTAMDPALGDAKPIQPVAAATIIAV